MDRARPETYPNMPSLIGLGVAGNVAGHLEQAGEAADFADITVADADGPKGIFPFYIPKPAQSAAASGPGAASHTLPTDHFLLADPMSPDTILHPGDGYDLQIEPEVGLWCEIEYDGTRVASLRPTHASAHNDCSIRRPPAPKISRKKNWGPGSKGVAATRIAIDRFAPGGILDRYRVASFLERAGALHAYGVDSPLLGYSYFHTRLLDWLVAQMNDQKDEGPLESISTWLEAAGHPRQALISIGATRYTDYGEATFLAPGDRAVVVLYDAQQQAPEVVHERLERALEAGVEPDLPGASVLVQAVRLAELAG